MHGHFWIPIDDETCWAWSFDYHPTRALTAMELAAMWAGQGIHTQTIPGSYIPIANRDNDYLMDRAVRACTARPRGAPILPPTGCDRPLPFCQPAKPSRRRRGTL